MATIESKETAFILLNNNGYYPGDPQLASIYSYIHTMTGDKLYGIYLNSADFGPYGRFCKDIKLLWTQSRGLTLDGVVELAELSNEKEGEKK